MFLLHIHNSTIHLPRIVFQKKGKSLAVCSGALFQCVLQKEKVFSFNMWIIFRVCSSITWADLAPFQTSPPVSGSELLTSTFHNNSEVNVNIKRNFQPVWLLLSSNLWLTAETTKKFPKYWPMFENNLFMFCWTPCTIIQHGLSIVICLHCANTPGKE